MNPNVMADKSVLAKAFSTPLSGQTSKEFDLLLISLSLDPTDALTVPVQYFDIESQVTLRSGKNSLHVTMQSPLAGATNNVNLCDFDMPQLNNESLQNVALYYLTEFVESQSHLSFLVGEEHASIIGLKEAGDTFGIEIKERLKNPSVTDKSGKRAPRKFDVTAQLPNHTSKPIISLLEDLGFVVTVDQYNSSIVASLIPNNAYLAGTLMDNMHIEEATQLLIPLLDKAKKLLLPLTMPGTRFVDQKILLNALNQTCEAQPQQPKNKSISVFDASGQGEFLFH